MTSLVLVSLLAIAPVVQAQMGVPFDPATHTPLKSAGCGKTSPYTAGKSVNVQGKYAGVTWTYRVYVPKAYNKETPMPLILQHPGWGMSASSEEAGAGITGYAESLGFISVTPQGMDDNTNSGGPWYSWNAAGTSQSPGPAGATCTSKASAPSYCYTSCNCKSLSPQCDWTTCDETITPTGTGKTNVGGFLPGLYDTLESQLCIDTSREYAAGESNGGIQTYQLGVDLNERLAAIAPQFGSFAKGFAMAPDTFVPVIDLHGTRDTTVPANVSLSGDGYYYTTTDEIMNGGAYSTGWKKSNKCDGVSSHWPTKYDGGKFKFYCVSECSDASIVRCSWNGGHNWLFNDAASNGWLVTDFLLRWTKPSHVGFGRTADSGVTTPTLLENVVVVGEDQTSSAFGDLPVVLKSSQSGHYGDPDAGCLSDEDVVLAGTGRVCAPRVGVALETEAEGLPIPQCMLGDGNSGGTNGCPTDAAVDDLHSKARPTCIATGNTTDPYNDGNFHCLLMCPCEGQGNHCGVSSHAHCPTGSRCERGDLRNRAHGVCTYHGEQPASHFTEPVIVA